MGDEYAFGDATRDGSIAPTPDLPTLAAEWGRSTHTGPSPLLMAASAHAPHLPFATPTGTGSIGWIADLRLPVANGQDVAKATVPPEWLEGVRPTHADP